MVITQHEEILGAATLIARHQTVGIPVLGLEQGQDILIAKLRGMTVVLTVVLVFPITLHIHLARHPVATPLYTLGTPMGPDAELRITEPLWCLVLLERLPRRFKLSRLHLFVHFADGNPVSFLSRHRHRTTAQEHCY